MVTATLKPTNSTDTTSTGTCASPRAAVSASAIPKHTRYPANRFVGAPLRPQSLPRDQKLTPEVRKAEQHAHQLAERAITAKAWKDSGDVYAQMLTTCGSCHSLHGVVWGPRRSP